MGEGRGGWERGREGEAGRGGGKGRLGEGEERGGWYRGREGEARRGGGKGERGKESGWKS